jgi:nucleoid-associated protein YgaU
MPGRPPTGGHVSARDATRDGSGDRVLVAAATDRHEGQQSHGRSAIYTVRPGDSLWRIADRHLGPGATAPATAQEVTRLWEINAQRIGTGDPDLIFPGQRLRM